MPGEVPVPAKVPDAAAERVALSHGDGVTPPLGAAVGVKKLVDIGSCESAPLLLSAGVREPDGESVPLIVSAGEREPDGESAALVVSAWVGEPEGESTAVVVSAGVGEPGGESVPLVVLL